MHKNTFTKIRFNHPIIVVCILTFVLGFWRIWESKTYFSDELLIEEAAYGFAHGEWIINPLINGAIDLAKPPLVYWLHSLFFLFTSPTPLLLRLPTVIMGVALVLSVYKLARLKFQKDVSLLASVLVATNGLFLIFVKSANFDIPNALITTLAIYFYNKEKRAKYFCLTAIFLTLGILTRSFLALLIPLIILLDYLFLVKKNSKKYLVLGLSVLLLVTPWHLAAYLTEPSVFLSRYLKLIFAGHVVELLAGDNPTTVLFYFKIFLFFPLALLGVYYLVKNFRANSLIFQLSALFIVLFLVLSISQTRHEWYAVPLIVPLAIFSAKQITEIIESLKNKSIYKTLFVAVVGVLIVIYPVYFLFTFPPELDVIKTAKYMASSSNQDETLFVWQDLYFTPTRFFPKRRVEVLNPSKLSDVLSQNSRVFLMVKKKMLFETNFNRNEKIYDGGDYDLYLLDSADR